MTTQLTTQPVHDAMAALLAARTAHEDALSAVTLDEFYDAKLTAARALVRAADAIAAAGLALETAAPSHEQTVNGIPTDPALDFDTDCCQ